MKVSSQIPSMQFRSCAPETTSGSVPTLLLFYCGSLSIDNERLITRTTVYAGPELTLSNDVLRNASGTFYKFGFSLQ